jgi:hypothetical protein
MFLYTTIPLLKAIVELWVFDRNMFNNIKLTWNDHLFIHLMFLNTNKNDFKTFIFKCQIIEWSAMLGISR